MEERERKNKSKLEYDFLNLKTRLARRFLNIFGYLMNSNMFLLILHYTYSQHAKNPTQISFSLPFRIELIWQTVFLFQYSGLLPSSGARLTYFNSNWKTYFTSPFCFVLFLLSHHFLSHSFLIYFSSPLNRNGFRNFLIFHFPIFHYSIICSFLLFYSELNPGWVEAPRCT